MRRIFEPGFRAPAPTPNNGSHTHSRTRTQEEFLRVRTFAEQQRILRWASDDTDAVKRVVIIRQVMSYPKVNDNIL